MPHWKTIVRADSKFLTLADIAGMTPLKVTVVKVTTETAHNPGDHTDGVLLCLHFKGGKKALGLNNTNAFTVETMTGEGDYEKWPVPFGVTLRAAVCKGDECIRLDVPKGIEFPGHYPKFTYTDINPKETK